MIDKIKAVFHFRYSSTLASMLMACLFLLLPCSLKASEIDIKANYMEYDEIGKFVIARGSITVMWEDKILKAQNLKYFTEQDFMVADTSVVFRQNDNLMFSDAIEYNLKTGSGSMKKVSGIMQPWSFYAGSMAIVGEKDFTAKSIKMTTCDLRQPHYHIRSNHAKIRMKERIIVYNPIFYVRNVPVFYSPLYISSLKGSKLSIEIEPGYNSEDGFILKTIIGYPLSDNSYGKLYLDSYAKRGLGKGFEYNYYLEGKLKGTLYGYHIRENTTESERWNMRGSYWQQLNPLWTGQLQLNYMSDSSFTSIYTPENWQRRNQQLNSALSFTRQSSGGNLRITTERQDNYDSTINAFVMERLTLPRLEYTMYTSRGKMPFYSNFSAWVQNQYTRSNDYYLIDANADYNITKDLRAGRKTTLTPRIGITEYWRNKTTQTDLTPYFVTRYYHDMNIRYRLLRWVDWDYGYNYKIRTEPNTILPDTLANDYGEETKQVYFGNSMYLSRKMSMRNSTSYDFRVARNETISDWTQKLNPLVNELTWAPKLSLSLYLTEESGFYPNHYLKSFQALSQIGSPDAQYVNLGFFYQNAAPDQYDFSFGFGIQPTIKWKLDFNTRTSALNNFRDFRTTYYEAKVYRDLHCWETSVTYRRILDVVEVYFKIGLKTSSEARKKLYKIQQEREFYPWR